MLGKDDSAASDGAGGSGSGSSGPCPAPVPRKQYWRSASWSASRTMLPPDPIGEKDGMDPSGENVGGLCRFNVPLTPRTQGKARSLLPPLQPLAISRRSLDEWPKAGSDDVGEWPLPCTPGGRDLSSGGDRLKLDLSSIRSKVDRNSGLVKKDKIAVYDKECSKVVEHIYLGGDGVARDRVILKQHGITHILNCVGFVCPEYFKSDFVYRTLWLQDSPSEDITSILYDVFDYFEDVREQKGHVFVHCCQGVSRSTSLVIAYIMWREGKNFDDAFQYVKTARGIADPNMGFACQLLQCQKRVHAFPLSPSSLLRMYRIASHSPYDPLHLVPKLLNSPSPAALDSRGAFIIHIPSTIYVWIGSKCETTMEQDARGAACQIVRYEKLQVSITAIKEGEEPSYFWDAFSEFLPIIDKSSNGVDVVELSKKIVPGEREVSKYSVEFEIFLKAVVGGFVPPFASSDTDHETHLPVRESSWSMLRRKSASGSMNEFASASKSSLSRVYPDSVLKKCLENSLSKPSLSHINSLSSSVSSSSPSSTSFSSSSTVSSSSPPCLSPKSLSSDSSRSSKNSSDGRSSQSVSQSSKKPPLSIAERRGSKLPMLTDDSRDKDAPPSGATRKTVGLIMKNDNYSPDEHTEEMVAKGDRGSNAEPMSQLNPHRTSGKTSDEGPGNKLLDAKCTTDFSGLVDINLSCPKQNQLVVCRWPSLEKIVSFCAADLDSQDIFILVAPASGLGKLIEHKVLYIWVGKCISLGDGKMLLKADQEIGELKEINWSEVSFDVITQMGLPDDTDVKIVRQEEEPEEFLALLGSL
ncbi:Protein-tyrosine-phosphatase MKP1 [Heracleum sosnowskyi]|uniref:Protein-tyrosine-phosphatase MKP1 n=1 Tax=Heracleum sosnowskyi TaxID=360622 RepID=A0AAD8M0P3_9APIA|nr:Protein-tyrosine-phosphatase MKP1 [Heracleum sosnowskyi]